MKSEKKLLPKKSDDISKWYLTLIETANLADYGPTKGTIIIKPYGYALWENFQAVFDPLFKKHGVKNAYFPSLIPYSLLEKEKRHISGFSPELAVVTIAGGEELSEKLVIRPTSETIMYEAFSRWISSYRDLPLKINQWCNVVRWEKRTYPFLRTSEFLWQEGHTVHATVDEAQEMTLQALNWYKTFYEEVLAIAPHVGEKSGSERFAGADKTFSVELVIPNGKALQAATSHNLGTNFSKSFKVQYLDTKNHLQYAHQTSWGLSTRAIGGLILVHGDDNGLIIPPRIAPYQVVILPIEGKTDEQNREITVLVKRIEELFEKNQIRFVLMNEIGKTLGYRLNETEIMGIPMRIEIGAKEAEKNFVTFSDRIEYKKRHVSFENLVEVIEEQIEDIQVELLKRSLISRDQLTEDVDDMTEFKKIMEIDRKFLRAFWCEGQVCETKIKEITKATTRVIELEHIDNHEDGKCIYCGNPAQRKWLFAQAY
ncbi:proline--tRNA ligase [Candidatus Roizmanbacteria bacterium RIFCSPHIGHO2_01_FULL_39_12b]|uniref:Proline--tRNA ligase n=1 Tax=Candidatus Roizmanbacteria bacterium RIFCSPHIGHO2_01_FULL_39_12b TaxID=1802030 RepID=A0A1F7G7Q0_9BACT|nr:MAG: proline--tRNA ligase [Candidatus Roizmanbacteria bacterium RIFCSPHIGHO2_01_FULL_39_12b]